LPSRGAPRRADPGGRLAVRLLSQLWANRRNVGALWWRGLGELGLSRDRFHSLPGWQQRAAKVALGGAVAFLVSVVVNTLERFFGQSAGGSIVTFDRSAYIAFAVVALLLIPEWRALPVVPLKLVIPGALLVGGVAGLVTGLATDNTRNGVIASVGTVLALAA